jgi:hypothetical protein
MRRFTPEQLLAALALALMLAGAIALRKVIAF